MFTILGIAGSLRKDSFNKKLLQAAVDRCPKGAKIEVLDWSAFPVFNQDMEAEMPQTVLDAKAKIRAADAVLFVTPEYNYGIPGPLKNVIDWCSRPYGDSAWEGKPCAMMGASPGMLGTVRAQVALRQSLVFLNMIAVMRPEVYVGNAHEKFDENGKLIDEKTGEYVAKLLEALIDFTQQITTKR